MRLRWWIQQGYRTSAKRKKLLLISLTAILALTASVYLSHLLPQLILGYLSMPRIVQAAEGTYRPTYTPEGNLIPPANYREWIFLSTGYDMAYTERTGPIPEHTVFDNVFVNPESYAAFQRTGTWPDKTVLVLENREARSKGEALVKAGRFQGEVSGLEIHIKDSTHFKEPGPGGQWAFFGVHNGSSKLFPRTASCYTCHADHAAVDTTFVQFYPTLLPIAEAKSTLSEPYKKDRTTATPSQPNTP